MASVGRRVAELRVRRGSTQEQVAAEADLSLKYLQRVEAGRENLTIRSLVRFANFFKVPVRALFAMPRARVRRRGRPPRRAAG